MIYATVYPEKFEGDKGVKLMQVAFWCDKDRTPALITHGADC